MRALPLKTLFCIFVAFVQAHSDTVQQKLQKCGSCAEFPSTQRLRLQTQMEITKENVDGMQK